jgi:flagellar motility protein MotE (MotC chaperone)
MPLSRTLPLRLFLLAAGASLAFRAASLPPLLTKDGVAQEQAPAEAPTAAKEEEEEEEEEAEDVATEDAAPPPPAASPNADSGGLEQVDLTKTDRMEKDLLDNLMRRRQELEEWSKSIALKENVLNATEKKINRKLEELRTLKEDVQTILKEYEQKENAKVAKLVKIYENMRPKDAARIFDDMDNALLIELLNRMKEVKAAPILAGMKTDKVSYITARLMQYRRLSKEGKPAP